MIDQQIMEEMSNAFLAIFLDDNRSYVGRHNDAMRAAFVVCAAAIRDQDAEIAEGYDSPNGSIATAYAIATAIRAQEPRK
jgi:hypothetical protein